MLETFGSESLKDRWINTGGFQFLCSQIAGCSADGAILRSVGETTEVGSGYERGSCFSQHALLKLLHAWRDDWRWRPHISALLIDSLSACSTWWVSGYQVVAALCSEIPEFLHLALEKGLLRTVGKTYNADGNISMLFTASVKDGLFDALSKEDKLISFEAAAAFCDVPCLRTTYLNEEPRLMEKVKSCLDSSCSADSIKWTETRSTALVHSLCVFVAPYDIKTKKIDKKTLNIRKMYDAGERNFNIKCQDGVSIYGHKLWLEQSAEKLVSQARAGSDGDWIVDVAFNSAEMEIILRALYAHPFEEFTSCEQVVELLRIVKEFELSDLAEELIVFLIKNASQFAAQPEQVARILSLASDLSIDSKLARFVLEVARNAEKMPALSDPALFEALRKLLAKC